MIPPEVIFQRIAKMKSSVAAALLRTGRRIEEGFEGEIVIAVKAGGVHSIKWVQYETGETIKEELE